MLTLAKVQMYAKFNGDIDGYSRSRKAADASGITDDDWALITRLAQALSLITSGQASEHFRAETEQELNTVAPDEPTRSALRFLVRH